jgi:hypothetical protein
MRGRRPEEIADPYHLAGLETEAVEVAEETEDES